MLPLNALLLATQLVGRLVVEPDVLASHDTASPHVEMTVAASPVDARRLLATTIVADRTKTYLSVDGGYSWSGHDFDDPEVIAGGSDPQTFFTRRGTALFITLGSGTRPDGRSLSLLLVYRSEDGGVTWSPKIAIGGDSQWDRPIVTMDKQGSIYIAATAPNAKHLYEAAVMRSDDDGRTFTAPVTLATAPEGAVMNVLGIAALDSGKIAAVVMQTAGFETYTMTSELSADRGGTWSEPHAVATYSLPKEVEKKLAPYQTWPLFAADESGVYGVWTTMRDGSPRIEFASSKDGVSWSAARLVEPGSSTQYSPTIAAGGGALAIAWFDTRDLTENGAYRVRFTASTDQGRTFLPSRVISSEVSHALGRGNAGFEPASFVDHRGIQRVAFVSAVDRFFNGGDYCGLAADRDGVFHPFWADSRTGTFQCWTARVHVARDAPAPCVAQTAVTDISKRVALVADPISREAGSNEVAIPFRIRNDGDAPIAGPLTIEVLGFGDGPKGELHRESAPTIVNAPNGRPGAGAVFDYSAALGDLCTLAPGASTEAVTWRFRVQGAAIPQMSVVVHGVVVH
jgi:hypothetical protein